MIKIFNQIKLDVEKNNEYVVVRAKQGDKNSRFITATLCLNGNMLIIPVEAKVRFNVVRADEAGASFDGLVLDDGRVTVPLDSWITSVSGLSRCSVEVNCRDQILSTMRFTIDTEESDDLDDVADTVITPDDPEYSTVLRLIDDYKNGKLSGGELFVRYSSYSDGTEHSEVQNDEHSYVGIYVGKSAPEDKAEYAWFGISNGGKGGTTFIPDVSEDGVLSWSNDGGLENPEAVKIKGADGKGIDNVQHIGVVIPGYSTFDVNYTDGSCKTVNIPNGKDGVVFTPHVSADGTLSWSNDGGLANPDPINIISNAESIGEIVQDTGDSEVAVMSQKAVTNALGNIVNETAGETQKAEMGSKWVSSGMVSWGNSTNNGYGGTILNIKENASYEITVSGTHNRFYVSGSKVDDPVTGTAATTIYNSGNSATRSDTESVIITNTDGYKHLIVTVCYNVGENTAIVEYRELGDGSVTIGGYKVYTTDKVDEIALSVEENGKDIADSKTVYVTERDVAAVGRTEAVYALYDELLEKYPSYISKNTLGQNSEGTDIYEYVFTSGNYNDATTQRSKDDVVVKPTVLVISGVHGYEKSAVMSTYQFFRDMADYSAALHPLREGITFKVIPVVTPYSYTYSVRLNENGVNINRNFDCNWTLTAEGQDYSGASVADQSETQIVQAWINANTDAYLCIDHHNSGYEEEVSMISGLNTGENIPEIKKQYLCGLNRIIPYWQSKIGLLGDIVYSYTGFIGNKAMSTDYAQSKGITSICLETSWNQNGLGQHGKETIAVGAEVLGNMLLEIYKHID